MYDRGIPHAAHCRYHAKARPTLRGTPPSELLADQSAPAMPSVSCSRGIWTPEQQGTEGAMLLFLKKFGFKQQTSTRTKLAR